MQLYCFTGSDKISQENLEKTIYKKISLEEYREYLSSEEIQELTSLGLMDGCHMWGAEPGPSNSNRWEKVENGDRILGYSQKKFICYGPIVYKIHNRRLAKAIWGVTENNSTWEYINVFGDLKYIDVDIKRFNNFFGYKEKYKPQGFTNVDYKKIKSLENTYGSLDEIISLLSDKKIIVIEESIEEQVTLIGDVEVESIIENMDDEKFMEYIKSLDASASYETIEKCVKVRKYNKKLLDDIKKLADYTCQVDGCNCGKEHGVSIVEAHHIEKFSLTQNNKPDNILILCPNHHRLIHKTKAIIDKKICKIYYNDGSSENYKQIIY